MEIAYHSDRTISVDAFADLLARSGLAHRRPVNEPDRLSAMLKHASILCTGWHDELLVGVARSITDFSYCCYLSDLAVDVAWQKKGIGRALVDLTRKQLDPKCKVILLAAPAAQDYYPKIGFAPHHSAWVVTAGHAS